MSADAEPRQTTQGFRSYPGADLAAEQAVSAARALMVRALAGDMAAIDRMIRSVAMVEVIDAEVFGDWNAMNDRYERVSEIFTREVVRAKRAGSWVPYKPL